VDPNRDQLVRYAPFDLRQPHGMRHGWRALRARHESAGRIDADPASVGVRVTRQGPSEDIDPDQVTAVLLYAAAFFGFLLLIAVGVAAVFALRTLRHW
jgi:hypothetical protein